VFLDQLLEKGRRAMESGDYKEAVVLFEKYLSSSRRDDDTEAEMLLAEAAERNGDYPQAMGLYDKLAKSSNQLRAQNALAYHAMLQARIGQAPEAKSLWEEYLQRFPDGVHAQEALIELAVSECKSENKPHLDLLMKKYPALQATHDLEKKCAVDVR
jgi:tetratricopeptide (TPR) repeat protein